MLRRMIRVARMHVRALALRTVPLMALAIALPAQAITLHAYYRFGEDDPGAADGQPITSQTRDHLGARHLLTGNNPAYSSDTGLRAQQTTDSALSFRAIAANGTHAVAGLTFTPTDNFVIEAYVKPDNVSGTKVVVWNGTYPSSGYGIVQIDGNFRGQVGGNLLGVCSSSGTWLHVALVRDNGEARFYCNATLFGTTYSGAVPAPSGAFGVGGAPPTMFGPYYDGRIDELRLWTFAAGTFSTSQLLVNAPDLDVHESVGASSGGALPDGGPYDFGDLAPGQHATLNVRLLNGGYSDLSLGAVTIDGPDAAMFTLEGATPPATMAAASAGFVFGVEFAPTSPGTKTATLHIASDDPNEAPYDIVLTGDATSHELEVRDNGFTVVPDGATLAYTDVVVGAAPIARNLRIYNLGGSALTLTGNPPVAISGTDAGDFSVVSQPASSYAGIAVSDSGFETPDQSPGGFTYTPSGSVWTFGAGTGVAKQGSPWYVTLAPENDQAAFLQSLATISRTIDCPMAGAFTLHLSAAGRSQGFGSNPLSLRLGGNEFGSIAALDLGPDFRRFSFPMLCPGVGPHTLAIVGTGVGDVGTAIDDVVITGGNAMFQVQFQPTGPGLRTATLSMPNNDADEGAFDLVLSGNGLQQDIAVFNGASTAPGDERGDNAGAHAFGNVVLGASSAQTFTIRNSGTASLDGIGVSVSGGNAGDFSITSPGTTSLAPNATTTFTVTFTPASAGTRGSVVLIASNDPDENPFEIPVTGTGTTPEIDVFTGASTAPADARADGVGVHAFSDTAVGATSATQVFTIRNAGTANLVGLALTKSGSHGSDYTLGALGATTLAPGATTTFGVTFAPSTTGARTATVAIASNDANENPFEVNLTGNGLAAEIEVFTGASTAPADARTDEVGVHAFSDTAVGATSATQVFTIRNAGTANLVGLALTKSGSHGSDYTLGTLGATTLAPGASTTFGVTFAPSTMGARTATVAIASNDANENPFEVNLTGNGLAAEIEVFRGASTAAADARSDGAGLHAFADAVVGGAAVPQVFTIRNAGTSTLASLALSVSGANAGDFVAGGLGATTLAPSATTTFTVSFAPSATGERTATVAIASNDADENPFEIALGGSGTAPEIAVDQAGDLADGATRGFGSIALGSNSTLDFNVTNRGTAQLTLDGNPRVAIAGLHAGEFTVTQQPAATLGVESVALANPGFETPPQAANQFVYTPPAGEWSYAAAAGVARIGSPWFVQAPLQGVQAAFLQSQPNGTKGSVSRTVYFPAAGTYRVRFALVRRSAAYPANDVSVRIDGVEIGSVANTAQPDDTWRTFEATYDCVVAGGHVLSFVATRSGGDFASALDAVTVAPAPAANTTTFRVAFAPSALGARTATLAIANDDANEDPFEVVLEGAGVAAPMAEIAIHTGASTAAVDERADDAGTHAFADTAIGSSTATQLFTIRNAGTAALTGLALSAGSAHPGDFALVAPGTATLAPGATTTFGVTFAPTAAGARTATIAVASNDADENPFEIRVTGTGIETQADLQVSKTNFETGLLPGRDTIYTIQVLNAGPASVSSVRVVDALPAALTNAQWTCTSSPPALCPSASGTGSIDETTAGALASGALLEYVVVATPSGTPGAFIANTATVAGLDPVAVDPAPANNSATDTDVVVPDGIFTHGFEGSGASLLRSPLRY